MNFKDRMVSAAGWEGKMKPVCVNGMFFADNPDTMKGWGVGMERRKNNWALWVDGHGFVCADDNIVYPVRPYPLRMEKEVAKELCKTGIAHWGKIFFVENVDYYRQLIEKAVKKMGYIQFENTVDVHSWIYKEKVYTISSIEYVEGLNLCGFYANGKYDSLNCYDSLSIVRVGRELVKTLNKWNVTI